MHIPNINSQNLAALLVILALLPVNQIFAREWYVAPSLTISLEYDDNRRLTPKGDEVFGHFYEAQAELGTRSEDSDFNLNLGADINRYPGNEELNTNNWLVGLNSFYTVNERNTFSISGSFVSDTTLTSEFEDTGLVQERKRRIAKSVNPRWSRSLTERTSLQAGYSYNDVGYKDAQDTGLFDFSSQSADIGILYTLDDSTTDIGATISASRFETPSLDRNTDNYSIQFTVDRAFSSVTNGSVRIGPRVTREQFPLDGERTNTTSTGFAGELSLAREFYSDRLSASLSRAVRPSGLGNTQETDSLYFNWLHDFSSRLDFTLAASVSRNKSTGDDSSGGDRTAFSLAPGLSYQLSPEWRIDGGYRYRRQKISGGSNAGAAESNAVSLSIRYQGPRLAASR